MKDDLERFAYLLNQTSSLDPQISINFLDKDKIQLGEELGKGGFGCVYSAKYSSLILAIKKVKQENYNKETQVLHRMRHPNISLFYGMYLEKQYANLALEKIDGICLDEFIIRLKILKHSFSEEEIFLYKLIIAINLVVSIEFLHLSGIVHRDIKPNNIMINHNHQVKLLDFGISKISSSTYSTENPRLGTLIYMSPEYCPSPDDFGNLKVRLSSKIDVWAVGLVLNELFSGEKPWSNRIIHSNYDVMSSLYKKIKFPVSEELDSNIKEIIKNCTEYDSEIRWDMTKVKYSLFEIMYNKLSKNNRNNDEIVDKKEDNNILNSNNNHQRSLIINLKDKVFSNDKEKKYFEFLKIIFNNDFFNYYYNNISHNSILENKNNSNNSNIGVSQQNIQLQKLIDYTLSLKVNSNIISKQSKLLYSISIFLFYLLIRA